MSKVFVKSDNETVDISYGVIKRQVTEFISHIKGPMKLTDP